MNPRRARHSISRHISGFRKHAAGVCLLILLHSCASRPKPWEPTERLAAAPHSTSLGETPDDSPVAMLAASTSTSRHMITWADLRAPMAERAGAEVLEEAALDFLLVDHCLSRAIDISQPHIDSERAQLLSTLSSQSALNPQDAERALTTIRARRGLGEHRFAALLKRNAMLRALVNADPSLRSTIEPTSSDIDTARGIKYGQRVRARLILVATPQEARAAIERISTEGFDAVARALSLDPSAPSGGLISPVGLADPAQPAALRRVLGALPPHSVSPPFDVEIAGRPMTAIVRHEGVVDSSTIAQPESDADIADEIRRVRERAAMQSLAQRLIAESDLRIIDRHLGWSWDNRSQRQ